MFGKNFLKKIFKISEIFAKNHPTLAEFYEFQIAVN